MTKPVWLDNVPARVNFEVDLLSVKHIRQGLEFQISLDKLLTLFVENGWTVHKHFSFESNVTCYSLRKPYPPDLDTPARRIINLNPSPVAVTEPSHRTGRS